MESLGGVVRLVASVRDVAEAPVALGRLPVGLHGAVVWSGRYGVSGVRLGPDGARWYRGACPAALAPDDFPSAVAVAGRFVVVFDSPDRYDRAADLVGLRDPCSGPVHGPVRVGLLAGGRPDWFEVGEGDVLSLVNAYEDLGRVVVDAVWAPGVLRRHVIDLVTGRVRRVELPAMDVARVDGRVSGRRHRFAFGAAGTAVVWHDVALGCTWRRELGVTPGRPVFVPRGREEGDGWVVVVAGDEVLVLDAADLAGPPVAVVRLPFPVPASRSAVWLDGRP